MRGISMMLFLLLAISQASCDSTTGGTIQVNPVAESSRMGPSKGVATNVAEKSAKVATQDQEPNAEVPSDSGQDKPGVGRLLDFANKLLQDQAASGSEGAEQAQKWLSDRMNETTESSGQIADDAARWAAESFESLKLQGLTSATTASQWLTEDIRNMNALKYKIVKVATNDLDALEEELNTLGKLRWDCFHAIDRDGETILFFKKERTSLLKNMPVKDMMKLIPLMGPSEQ